MSFTPHTPDDVKHMLQSLGETKLAALFDEVPASLLQEKPTDDLPALNEMQLAHLMQTLAKKDEGFACYLGAGSYEHFIPAAVWEVASRGEFLTAYTPYQAEASQGGLQLIYEYQTMIANLTAMDAANASVYDGATALAEGLLMAVRQNRHIKEKTVLIAGNLHPHYAETVKTILTQQAIEVVETGVDPRTGLIDLSHCEGLVCAAFAIAHPNFFGGLEAVDQLTDWAHAHNMIVVASVNPMSLALLKPPGQWGARGADIATGDGQPLGVPMASGGPYFGFMSCQKDFIRQLPGRIVGRTVDVDGKPGFTLTLQAREQHIRRGKAKSNICTNQGLLVTAATIYMSLMGYQGLRRVARLAHHNAERLKEKLQQIPGVRVRFDSASFHEFVIELPVATAPVLSRCYDEKILPGLALKPYDANLHACLLVCVTETKNDADIDYYAKTMASILQECSHDF